MKHKYLTVALCGFFNSKPKGDYHPFDVKTEIGINHDDWRSYARRSLYPEDSKARLELAKVGVVITSSNEAKSVRDGGELIVSVFRKEPRETKFV